MTTTGTPIWNFKFDLREWTESGKLKTDGRSKMCRFFEPGDWQPGEALVNSPGIRVLKPGAPICPKGWVVPAPDPGLIASLEAERQSYCARGQSLIDLLKSRPERLLPLRGGVLVHPALWGSHAVLLRLEDYGGFLFAQPLSQPRPR